MDIKLLPIPGSFELDFMLNNDSEVKSFSEAVYKTAHWFSDLSWTDEEYEIHRKSCFKNELEMYNEFYNQPFIPQMIIEYFKGWYFNENGFYIEKHSPGVRLDTGNGEIEFGGYWRMPYPKTISDFIDSCGKVGIKLKWSISK